MLKIGSTNVTEEVGTLHRLAEELLQLLSTVPEDSVMELEGYLSTACDELSKAHAAVEGMKNTDLSPS